MKYDSLVKIASFAGKSDHIPSLIERFLRRKQPKTWSIAWGGMGEANIATLVIVYEEKKRESKT